jgi:DNA-binding XRE family transcriptional regulator
MDLSRCAGRSSGIRRWTTMKLTDLPTSREVQAEDLALDPVYRAEWERTRFAHEVAMMVIQFRVEHGLTQTEMARRLGMSQPHVARLEAGDHEPSLAMLRRLAHVLGIEFHITASDIKLTA